jgi:hypothetical protein
MSVPEQSMKALATGMSTMTSPDYNNKKFDSPVDEKAAYKYDDARLETVNELDPEALKNDKVDYSGFAKKSDPREIALVRKLDIRIMGSLWSMVRAIVHSSASIATAETMVAIMQYWLNYLDRNAIALAKLSSLTRDLSLTDTQYQTCVSILCECLLGPATVSSLLFLNALVSTVVGYIIFGVPSNMILSECWPLTALHGTEETGLRSDACCSCRCTAKVRVAPFLVGVMLTWAG